MFVIVPGLRGPVENHWQTILATKLPNVVTVPSFDRDKLDLIGRIDDLVQTVQNSSGPVTLVAHSAGVLVTAHWAATHDTSKVQGALLATPPDLVKQLPAEYPSLAELGAAGWLDVPRERLDFPSIVAGSTNDPLADIDNVRALADSWGSHFENVGPVGHLNPAAGFGEWPQADELLGALR
jgi:predicted alpha/beta hydrolase family esterase